MPFYFPKITFVNRRSSSGVGFDNCKPHGFVTDPTPTTEEGVKKSSPPQRGGIFVERDLRDPHPSGVRYPSFPIGQFVSRLQLSLNAEEYCPRWGAAAATRSSTNMPPRWGAERLESFSTNMPPAGVRLPQHAVLQICHPAGV